MLAPSLSLAVLLALGAEQTWPVELKYVETKFSGPNVVVAFAPRTGVSASPAARRIEEMKQRLRKEPKYHSAQPQYGIIPMDLRGANQEALAIVKDDSPEPGVVRLYVDLNNDGDLTNDGEVLARAGTPTPIRIGRRPYFLNYWLVKNSEMMTVDRAFVMEGEWPLDGKKLKVQFDDPDNNGVYDKPTGRLPVLRVDINGDGQLDPMRENFRLDEPIRIGTETYQVASAASDGSRITFAVSGVKAPLLSAGEPAPEITNTGLDGKPVSLSRLRGRLVFVDFWATWCGPCREEFPWLKRVWEEYHPRGFEVLAISVDEAGYKEKVVKAAADEKLPWLVTYDGKGFEDPTARLYRLRGIPANVLVDRAGVIRGVNLKERELRELLEKLLGS